MKALEPRKSGSALLITLLVVSLLLVMVLSFTAYVRMELRTASNRMTLIQAQSNARLGMNLALAQLQKAAGPDQRVTARAEILDADPGSPAVTGVTQPFWTAVWHTGAAGLDVVDSGTPQRQISLGSTTPTRAEKSASATWLVSNPDPAAPLDPATWTGAHPSAVTLAKNLGVDELDVAVPLVGVPNGRYGYWVSDEGVKAKVNLTASTFNSDDAALSQLHLWSAHALPMHTILPVNTQEDFRTTPPGELGKVQSHASLAFLSTLDTPLVLNTYSPDITTHSYGVLSDVRRGGLKIDLTAAFEDESNFNTFADTYGNGDRSLYRSGLNLPNDGPLWYSLFYFYNTYKSVMPTPPGLSPNADHAPRSGIDIANPPYTLTPRGYRIRYPNASNPTFLNGPLPIVIAYRVDVAISSYQDGAGNWRLQLHYYPQLVVHNPYSVALSLPDFWIRKGLNAFRHTELNLTVGDTVLDSININQNLTGGRFGLRTEPGAMDSLQPGEIRVFALDEDIRKPSVREAGNFRALKSAGDENVSADFYQYVQLTDEFEGTMNGDDLVKMALSGYGHRPEGDSVRVGYMDYQVGPEEISWPLRSSGRYGMVPVEAFASPFVPGVWTDRPVSALVTPHRVLGFFARRKGLSASNSPDTYTHGAVGVPVFIGNSSVVTPFEDESSTQWMEVFLSPLGSLYTDSQTDINTLPSGETSWGDHSVGEEVSTIAHRHILRDIPSQPLVSLGQFMHMPVYRFIDGTAIHNHLKTGSMFTGGSVIPVNIPAEKTALVREWDNQFNQRLYMDDSFLANEALFDRFFLSTVPPAHLQSLDNPPAYWTQFNAANSGPRLTDVSTPFLNTRMKPYLREGPAPALADLRDPEQAAAHLMLDGAFNINSTSVPAWRALLSSLSGNRLGIWNATGGTMAVLDGTSVEDTNPIPRFWSASSSGTPNAAWDGLRVLTDAEINDLAEQIVKQVKTRGPFLSMGDFLNRRLGTESSAVTRAGALQAAIDNTSPDINQAAKARGTDVTMTGGRPPVIPGNLRDAAGRTLNTAIGIPGYLMQQDLVQAFSAVMTARSDTFVIRSYGEFAGTAAGEPTKAWLEAVVQRTPDYIDPSDSQLAAAGNATSPYNSDGSANVGAVNLQFGRRYKIVQYRWLKPHEL
ncbi:MAG: hypothetical protein JJU05_08950 [Verrucomicrobia bacterium]|nr:hypothetical protein [Verrucomicrobiota bacterium]MCH8526982.1 hypothetical protein [Kiritimatiellia bacterium]